MAKQPKQPRKAWQQAQPQEVALSDSQVATRQKMTKSGRREMMAVELAEGLELAANRFRYRLERHLGKGGFGSVYLARCLTCEGPHAPPEFVVLKFFHVPQTGDQLQLFRREVSSLLAFQHDRVIRLYDWRYEKQACFLVLEYFPAGSLLDTEYFLGTPVSEETLTRVLSDLLTALNAAHQASILHLDIKPANVLRDSGGGYVLTDFGISQGTLVSHHVIETGVGSPGYQAPEQREMNRRWIGPRTDLYGVGATAWSLYTGQRLDFQPTLAYSTPGETGAGLPPISKFRPCPPHLENLIMNLVAFYPDDRPGGAAEALAALNAGTGTHRRMMRKSRAVFQTGDPRLRPVLDRLVDPLWTSICSSPRPKLNFICFKDGEKICEEGEHAYQAYVLLKGSVAVYRAGKPMIEVSREGSFLGENAALTGLPRTATLSAIGETWCLVFNAAELEQFVVSHPAVAIRLIKTLALRARMNNGLV